MQHGFPGGPPQPPYGPPLRGQAPPTDAGADGPPTVAPDHDEAPPPRPDDPGPPREEHRPDDDSPRPGSAATPPPWDEPSPPDATDEADDELGQGRPTFAEVLAAQRALGRDAGPRHPRGAAPAGPDDLDDVVDDVDDDVHDPGLPGAHPDAPRDDGDARAQPPPPVPAGVGADTAGGWPPPPTPQQPSPPVPAATAPPGGDAWGPAPAAAVPPRSLARRIGRGIRNLVLTALVLLGLLAVIGFLLGEEEVEGAGEGAFAPVPTERCRELILDDAPPFPSGTAPASDVPGEGIGDPVWEASLDDPDRLLEPVSASVSDDAGDRVTLTLQDRLEGGAITSHLAVYDVTSGAVQGQLHVAARQVATAGDTRWFVGVSGGSALLFAVDDATIATCFAANAPGGSPAPPLTSRVDDELRPASLFGGEIAATPSAVFVVTRASGAEPTVQRLGRDGSERSVPDLDAVRGVHADDTQVYVTRGGGLASGTVDALDPDDLTRRWRTTLPDEVAVTGGPQAAATLGDTVTLVLQGTDTTSVRIARDDGTLEAEPVRLDARVRTVEVDGTHTYLVTPFGPDGEDATRVERLGADDDAPVPFDPGGLAGGGDIALRTPDAVALTTPSGRGVLGVLLQDGEVRATTQVPIAAVGGGHLVVLRWEPGDLTLLGVPLDPSDGGGGGGDADDQDADGADGGEDDGQGASGDADPADGDPTDGDPADGDPADGDGDAPAGGASGADGGAGGTGTSDASGGTGGGGGGGGPEVTDDADIDEEWLP